MPRGITAYGRTDRSLGKCFRDEDELAATHSLPDRILDALKNSSALVVVCSPDTQDSVWIQREIEAFIEMHGRERIFTVLAGGSSAESIPDLLRTKMAGSTSSSFHSDPLAADLRPEASKQSREEMLRLIAAIAGCGYDDLKQRDRVRRRKRMAIAAVSAVAALAVIVGAVVFASNAQRNTQIAESQRLAAESTQLLSNGDRYGAIEKALEALPKSEASNDRPLVPEARVALENALEISPNPNTPWLASYEICTDAPIGYIGASSSGKTDSEFELASALAVSESGGFFALSDGAGQVATYDIETGRKLADCIMPEEAVPLEDGLYCRTMGATENHLVVANGGENSVIAFFDARTGEMERSALGTGCPSFCSLPTGDLMTMSFPMSQGGYSVMVADLEEGASSSIDVREAGYVDATSGYFNTSGKMLGDNYSVYGNRLFYVQVDTGATKSVELAYPVATSLRYIDDLILVSSAQAMSDEDVVRRYAIEAFDSNLEPIWKHEGSFTSEMIVNNGITSLLTGEPVVQDVAGDGSAIVATVGRTVVVLDLASGKPLETISFDQTVVAVDLVSGSDDSPDFIAVACSNGVINCQELASGFLDVERDGRRLILPFPIRWAHLTECGDYYVLLAIPADSDDRIVSFRTDWTRGGLEDTENSIDYTLDELIELANAVLGDGGRI